ncbi:MAG TPA: RNA methyltransferase [Stellaceae bacterium]|nr:RNA methyltransferase [Stellaceae bacterium]
MAGTDHRRVSTEGGPAIILVEPQLGENIGTTARAMYNCGLTDLRLVRPREGWPSAKATAAASGADPVLAGARLFPRLEEAVSDLRHVFATTARDRFMVKPVVTPREAAAALRRFNAAGDSTGIVFGPERAGLINDHVALADTVINVPLNPAFSSLNLAQAVLLIAYEWHLAGTPAADPMTTAPTAPAPKEELFRFFEHFEEALDATLFWRTPHSRPMMVRNLRNLFQRAQCTSQELRTLHGVITAFVGPRERKQKPGE